MIRLGLRLAIAGGRGAVAGLALTATAVAVGTAVLLFALSFLPAVAERDARTAWMVPVPDSTGTGTLMLVINDQFGDRMLTRVHLAASGGVDAFPPHIAALPGPGEAYVSPALAALLAETPTDELGGRLGRVVGAIDEAGLASPDALVAVIGSDPVLLYSEGATPVSSFATEPQPRDLPPVAVLILVLAALGALAPVAVFVATATRMSAARRELRLSALRLVGATPSQVARLAVIEAVVATAAGSALGVLLFLLLRPLVARIPLDAATWWPDTIVPPPLAAIAMLVGVQVVGALGAVVTMRRLVVTPLGVQRRSAPGRLTALRAVPLLASIAALLIAISLYRTRDLPEALSLPMAGISFAAVIASLAFAGPWLTALVGGVLHRRATGAATLLAGRRLGDEPRGSFGAIAGVIMAVFVASAFFAFSTYTQTAAGNMADPLLQPDSAVAYTARGATTADLADRVARVPGVTMAVAVREVGLLTDDGFVDAGWLVWCPDLVAVLRLEGARCASSGISALPGFGSQGSYRLSPQTAGADGAPPVTADIEIDPDAVEALIDGESEIAGRLPSFIVDPIALRDPAIAASFPVNRIYVTTDGSPGVGERVRTAIVAVELGALVRLERERVAVDPRFQEIGRIVGIGLIGTLGLAGCSLAVAVTTATLDRRRQFVLLRSAGMPASTLRSMILLQALVPLAAVAIVSSLLGALVGVAILWIVTDIVALPDVSLVGVIVLSVVVAMLVVALTLAPLERMTRPLSVRSE